MYVLMSSLDRETEKEALARWYMSIHLEELRDGSIKSSGYVRHLTNEEE